MHALLEDIHVDFKFSAREQSGSFAIYSMQIDNQLLTSSRPVVLSHDGPPSQVTDCSLKPHAVARGMERAVPGFILEQLVFGGEEGVPFS